jgi:hypothetical protein
MSREEQIDLDGLARDSRRFRRRVVELSCGEELPIEGGTWRDAIVFLEAGEVELECLAGECRRFAAGAVLCVRPPVRVLRNSGCAPARLIAISRRQPAG